MLKINSLSLKYLCLSKSNREIPYRESWWMHQTIFLNLKIRCTVQTRPHWNSWRHLKEAETEIETLKNYIIELKQRIAVYIPVKDDPIDKRLAEFINNYPERQRLKIMFMRESEGVYQLRHQTYSPSELKKTRSISVLVVDIFPLTSSWISTHQLN
jgi:hypothetical protein